MGLTLLTILHFGCTLYLYSYIPYKELSMRVVDKDIVSHGAFLIFNWYALYLAMDAHCLFLFHACFLITFSVLRWSKHVIFLLSFFSHLVVLKLVYTNFTLLVLKCTCATCSSPLVMLFLNNFGPLFRSLGIPALLF